MFSLLLMSSELEHRMSGSSRCRGLVLHVVDASDGLTCMYGVVGSSVHWRQKIEGMGPGTRIATNNTF